MSALGNQTLVIAPPSLLPSLRVDLSALAHEAELHDFSEMCDRVQERVRDLDNPLLIMVVGEGKFGKSTLINALSGKVIAPVSIIPKTWKVDLYEAVTGTEDASLSWRSRPDAPETVAVHEAQHVCSEQESKAKETKVQEIPWKSDLYQVHWRVNAPWPPEGVALVDTPGFSQLRSDSSVSNTFLYGSKGIVFEASDAFKYYFYRADVVLWCVRSDKLQDHDTLEMLKASGKRKDIVGIITHMDKIPGERWHEVEGKARETFGDYISKFMFSALGTKGRPDLVDAIRSYLESKYISNKEETKASAIAAFLASERAQFLNDIDGVMELYKTNFVAREAVVLLAKEELKRLWEPAQRTLEDIVQRYYNRAVAKLDLLWEESGKNVERFEWLVRSQAAEPVSLFAELAQATASTATQGLNSANVLLAQAEWKGLRLNSDSSPKAFSSHVLSQLTKCERAFIAGMETTFTGGEGIGTGLTVGAFGAGIGAIALGPIGLAAGLIGLLAGMLMKRMRCMAKAKEALKNCYDENAKHQAESLDQNFTSTLDQFQNAMDRSLAEHHGKDVIGAANHAILADNSCMHLDLWPLKQRYPGPASFHLDGEIFESCYTADLAEVVPEIAHAWDVGCLKEWGEAIAKSFAEKWHQTTRESATLSNRERAVQSYAHSLKSIIATQMENSREFVIEPSNLLRECSIRRDLQSTIPAFHAVLAGCNHGHLRSLKTFTGTNYETELDSEYSKRVERAFADGRPYLGSQLIKSFQPGGVVTIAIVLGLIGFPSGITALVAIGAVGVVAAIVASLVSKRKARRRAMTFVNEVVGAFYQEVVSDLETSIREEFQPQRGTK